MSANTAELTLIIKARNLADTELGKVRDKLGGIGSAAQQAADNFANAFKGLGRRIGRELGNLGMDILSGSSVTSSLTALGATLAGAMIEGLAATLIPKMLTVLGVTAIWAPVAASMAAEGATLGGVLSAAIATGAVLLPFLLLAVAVGALVYLITNPEARQKAHDVAMMIIGRIGDGLRALGKMLYDNFTKGMSVAVEAVKAGVAKVVTWILSIPARIARLQGEIADNFRRGFLAVLGIVTGIVGRIIDAILAIPRAVASALNSLNLLNQNFNPGPGTGHGGRSAPPPRTPANPWGYVQSFAGGGTNGVTIHGVSQREIVDMVDRGLFFRLQRSTPTLGRT